MSAGSREAGVAERPALAAQVSKLGGRSGVGAAHGSARGDGQWDVLSRCSRRRSRRRNNWDSSPRRCQHNEAKMHQLDYTEARVSGPPWGMGGTGLEPVTPSLSRNGKLLLRSAPYRHCRSCANSRRSVPLRTAVKSDRASDLSVLLDELEQSLHKSECPSLRGVSLLRVEPQAAVKGNPPENRRSLRSRTSQRGQIEPVERRVRLDSRPPAPARW
jgi:hypothetical protein